MDRPNARIAAPVIWTTAALGALAWALWSANSFDVRLDATTSREAQLAGDLETLFSGVAEQVKRCVVSVTVTQSARRAPPRSVHHGSESRPESHSSTVLKPESRWVQVF